MTCPRTSGDHAILLKYVAGRLEASSAAALARHIQRCHFCAETVVEYSAVSDALNAWHAPSVSIDFNRALRTRIDAAEPGHWFHGPAAESVRFASLRHALPVAAAAVLIAAAFAFDDSFDTVSPAVSHVSATEADQAENALHDIQLLQQFDDALANQGPSKSR